MTREMPMCDAAVGVNDKPTTQTPFIIKCSNRATKFYRNRGPFGFGLYLCDEHKEMGLAH